MKRIFTTLLLSFSFLVSYSQTETSTEKNDVVKIRCGTSLNYENEPLYIINGVPLNGEEALKEINPEDIASISILRDPDALSCYGAAGKNGVVLIQTETNKIKKCSEKSYPFKVHCITNNNWMTQQDMYIELEVRVPSLRIQNKNALTLPPSIQMRGDDNTIVIVDGVRYDASILNTLNPQDIESVKVAPSVAATNYFLSGFRQ
ncbi:TonB-dependent receptor plug domain-containing protein [Maribacter sp. 2210JD10-5]|uniref:TonB-dependent receptor plug domain-containing protein n=1 Tax=Maribacter sp. 2210JD10-5 TaxID=3386272 RepID=UPI0039BD0819